MSSINRTQRNRIIGLSSGMDTQSLVDTALKAYKTKIDKETRKQIKNDWKIEEYKKIVSDLGTFRNKFMENSSGVNLTSSDSYRAYSSSMKENEYYSMSATTGAILGQYTIEQIKVASYAKAETANSPGKNASLVGATGSLGLSTATSNALKDSSGVLITAGSALSDIAGVEFGDVKLDDGSQVTGISFAINGTTLSFKDDATIQDVVDAVNAKTNDYKDSSGNLVKGSGAKVSFDGTTGKLKFESASMATDTMSLHGIVGNMFSSSDTLYSSSFIGTPLYKTVGSIDSPAVPNTQLKDVMVKDEKGQGKCIFNFSSGGQLTLEVSGTKITGLTSTSTLQDMVDKVNAFTGTDTMSISEDGKLNTKGSVVISANIKRDSVTGIATGVVDRTAGISATDTLAKAGFKSGDKVTLQLGTGSPVDITIDETKTVQDLMNDISNVTGGKVNLTINKNLNRFELRTTSNDKLEITGFSALGLGKVESPSKKPEMDMTLESLGYTDSTSITVGGNTFLISDLTTKSGQKRNGDGTTSPTSTVRDLAFELKDRYGLSLTVNKELNRFELREADGSMVRDTDATMDGFANLGLEGAIDDKLSVEYGKSSLSSTATIQEAAAKMGVEFTGETLSFKVNGQSFSFGRKTSIASMVSAVNSSAAGVKLQYSEMTGGFVFSSSNTGSKAEIKLENATAGSGNIDAFGSNSFFGITAGVKKGSDASITLNSGSGSNTFTSESNNFTMDGMRFNLTADYTAPTVPSVDTPKLTFSISQNNDSVVDEVKKMVADYNTVMGALYDKLNEMPSIKVKYEPLTSEEKKEIDDDDKVKELEAKAKEGMLRNDPQLSRMLSSMRAALYTKVGETGLSPSDIGIGTGEWDQYGRIKFDEAKFRKAMDDNTDAVALVMAGSGLSVSNGSSSKGFVTVVKESIVSYEKMMKTEEGSIKMEEKAKDETTKRIDKMTKDMYDYEDRLWAQYTQMEKLMSQYNSQSQYMSQLLGSM